MARKFPWQAPATRVDRVNVGRNLMKLAVAVMLAGLIVAAAIFPIAGGGGYLTARTADDLAMSSRSVIGGEAPEITTITDANGDPMAWLYDQRRTSVEEWEISRDMKNAIVSIEDRRFWDHSGVDWQGTLRAALANLTSGSVQQGASTIEQQLIKNHTLLVEAETEAERRAATATDYGRKLREIRIAQDLEDEMTKEEVLTGYLNIVPFGNGAFGIENAARTYFDASAKDLNIPQSALLAGLVQQTSGLNPYTNPDGAMARRNDVLRAMADTGAITQAQANDAIATDLGVLPEPNRLPQGCIAAGDRGFFCDYVIDYLATHGLDRTKLSRGGYTVKTTLDPVVQDNAQRGLREQASPTAGGVAEVMSIVEPGADSRRVLAMASSRVYGLDAEAMQTVQPQPFTPVGNGAGSIFKIFAATAAVEKGMGIDTSLPAPRRYEASGLGDGGAAGCPPGLYCVENTGTFPPSMTLREALAKSPNTPFVAMSEQVGVDGVVDMAVRLGMRSYTVPGSFDGESSVAQYVSDNTLGSFVLGPTPVDGLELSNVGATLASDGRWCEPNPIEEITDRDGNPVQIDRPDCEQAVDAGVAHAMAQALSADTVDGTAEDAARAYGWDGPVAAKTGTTESNQSAAFLGFTAGLAAAVYAYNDSPTVTELCTSPLRQCGSGDLYGGREPARTWFSAVSPIIEDHGGKTLPEMAPEYGAGTAKASMPPVEGMQEADARKTLEDAGYKVDSVTASQTGRPRGTVTGVRVPGLLLEGGTVTLEVSDGSRRPPPPRTTQAPPRPAPGGGAPSLPDSINIPGFGRIPLPR
ncbi:PASTA domain-containing protein [Corynebacterium xerosis]|uniref:PASTA domain-containing protein n=1 Tax=Corynebacterium xerosis TaxID=1725 RepID=A0A7X9XT60_9CORY|nr:transglycosylase domain-containing protein [Corynebacterium xerosis]NMF08990.1 PASTA domain-containing protein [Corynebacterium xerosis]